MLRFVAAVVVGISLPAVADVPRGKVIRVERERTIPLVVPVLCVQVQPDGSGLCIGPQPKNGELVVLIDETQVIAEIKIDSSTKAMPKCDLVWSITGSVVRGDITTGNRNTSFGLVDYGVSRSAARMIPKQKVAQPAPDTRVELGVDRDGDGTADMIAAEASCPGAAGGECIEFWTRRAKGLERVWGANLRTCQ